MERNGNNGLRSKRQPWLAIYIGPYFITLGKDGTTAIFRQPKDADGTTGWFEVPLDGSREPVEVYADDDIERIFTDRRTGVLTGFLRKGDTNEPVFFDPG